MKKKIEVIILFLILVTILSSCSSTSLIAGSDGKTTDLILATTTSTYDSGLLDQLLPEFEKVFPYRVKTIAVGSGEALAMGRRGEADVLLVHSPKAEEEFMADGFGESRLPVMYNRFILVGPADDPANVEETDNIFGALDSIDDGSSIFVSRGDESGTHMKELSLWKESVSISKSDRYLESGQGMGATLRIADEKGAYTLSDEGTFLSLKNTLNLITFEFDDQELRNPYSVIVVKGRSEKINKLGAQEFSQFITSEETLELIEQFGDEEYGRPLFTPINER